MDAIDQLSWEGVRIFLALASSPSLRACADRLGLTHPTVRRRLDELEQTLGVTLFHRRRNGLHLSVAGQALLAAASDAEQAMNELLRRAQAADLEIRGAVRCTVSSELGRLLAPHLAAFQRAWPQVQVIFEGSQAFADLSRLQADVAIRGLREGRRPPENLVGRRAAAGSVAVYGDPATGRWIGAQREAPAPGWTHSSAYADLPVGAIIPDVTVRHAACQAGMGIAMLPCAFGDAHLPRIVEPVQDFEIWVLVHPDLRENPRLRVFRDAMVDALKTLEPTLLGEGVPRQQPRQ